MRGGSNRELDFDHSVGIPRGAKNRLLGQALVFEPADEVVEDIIFLATPPRTFGTSMVRIKSWKSPTADSEDPGRTASSDGASYSSPRVSILTEQKWPSHMAFLAFDSRR